MIWNITNEGIHRILALQRVIAQETRNIDDGERSDDRRTSAGKEQFRPRRSRNIEEHPNLIFEGLHRKIDAFDPVAARALSVPFVLALILWMFRRRGKPVPEVR